MTVNALSKVNRSIPCYDHQFVNTIICTPESRECMVNACEKCSDGKGFKTKYPMNDTVMTQWFVWRADGTGRLNKCTEEGTLSELYDYTISMVPQFLEHSFVQWSQSKKWKEMKDLATSSECKQNHALIQVDFAENYTCQHQDEIQSAHWRQSQVSIFTSATWSSESFPSGVIVSDNLTRTKETIVSYLDKILEDHLLNLRTDSWLQLSMLYQWSTTRRLSGTFLQLAMEKEW